MDYPDGDWLSNQTWYSVGGLDSDPFAVAETQSDLDATKYNAPAPETNNVQTAVSDQSGGNAQGQGAWNSFLLDGAKSILGYALAKDQARTLANNGVAPRIPNQSNASPLIRPTQAVQNRNLLILGGLGLAALMLHKAA